MRRAIFNLNLIEMKNKLIGIVIVALCHCCTPTTSTTSEVIDVKVSENYVIDLDGAVEEDDLEIEIVSLTPLVQPVGFIGFSDHLQCKVVDDDYYVFDIGQQTLIVYDSLGNVLHKIGENGRGPGELNNVIDFTVNRNEVVFLKRAGNNSVLIVFDRDGNYIRDDLIPLSGTSLARFDSGDHLVFTGWNNSVLSNKLYRIEHANGELTGFFPHEFEEPKMNMEDDTFTDFNDTIYFMETLKPEIFQVTESNELKLFAYINYGDFAVDNDFWSKRTINAMEYLVKKGFYQCIYFWITEDLVALEGYISKNNEASQDVFLAMHHISNGTTKAKKFTPSTIDQLLMDIFQIKENHLYSLGDGAAIKTLGLEQELDVDLTVSETTYYLVKSELKM